MLMSAIIERAPDSVRIVVPAAGDHLGYNGFAKITQLSLFFHRSGTVSLDTINTRGTTTKGSMIGIPVASMLSLLEALKTEMQMGFKSDQGPSSATEQAPQSKES
jgi:hypothetical protein